jgi:hypothetical protein
MLATGVFYSLKPQQSQDSFAFRTRKHLHFTGKVKLCERDGSDTGGTGLEGSLADGTPLGQRFVAEPNNPRDEITV